MTKETKVGLVIGLLFIGAVIYVLNWATKPSEFEPQPSVYRPEVAYRNEPEPERQMPPRLDSLPSLSVTNTAPLSAGNPSTSVNDPAPFPDTTPEPTPAPVFQPPQRFHVVKPGETLSDIARAEYGAGHSEDWQRIFEANKYKIPNPHVIQADLKLLIPPLEAAASGSPQPRLPVETAGTYTVKEGDTLSDISSARLGTCRRWQEIYNLNRDQLPDEYSLRPGMVLKLPASSRVQLSLPANPDVLNTTR